MNRDEADALAQLVRRAAGQPAEVVAGDQAGVFEVMVTITHPQSGAEVEKFYLSDELDWDWLKEQIESG